MTTIVYRDGVLAADRSVAKNGVLVGLVDKIREVHGSRGLLGWVAVWGRPSDALDAVKWLSKWPEIDEAPRRFHDNDAAGFFLLKGGGFWVLEALPFQIEAEFHAAGSGWEIAVGALAMGASAVKAVEIAALYDQGTGGGVDSVGD